MRKRVICPLAWMAFLLAGASPLSAQDDPDLWSLERCIRYAQENNIDLKQKEQEKESRDIELSTSKWSWLPAVNAGATQSFQFGRSTTSRE